MLRVEAGFLFIQSGSVMLFGWFGGMTGGMSPPLIPQMGIVGLLELIGGITILLGPFTQPTTSNLSGMMAVAY